MAPETTEFAAPVPLAVLMKANPEAFKFDDIRPSAEDIGEIADLETMLGQHTQVRGRFYSRPLKAKHQKFLMRLAKQVAAADDDPLATAELVTSALQQILCIEQGEQYRECTTDEIDEAFSMQEQGEIMQELAGIYRAEGTDGGPK